MGNPIDSAQFAKLLLADLKEVSDEKQKYHDLNSMIPKLFRVITDSTRAVEEFYSVGSLPDIQSFDGRLATLGIHPGYSRKIEPGEFGGKVVMQRKFVDDKQYDVFTNIAEQLVDSANRKREKNAVKVFGNITSAVMDFETSEEGVSLASSSHKTKVPGVSTATGFSNVGSSVLSPTSVAATRILMRKFRTSIGERYEAGDEFGLLVPDELVDRATEIVGTDKGLDSAYGNKNTSHNRYQIIPYMRLGDYSTQSWGMVNLTQMKKDLVWIQRAKAETNRSVDFDTFQIMQSVYERHGCGWLDWRWIYWHAVG